MYNHLINMRDLLSLRMTYSDIMAIPLPQHLLPDRGWIDRDVSLSMKNHTEVLQIRSDITCEQGQAAGRELIERVSRGEGPNLILILGLYVHVHERLWFKWQEDLTALGGGSLWRLDVDHEFSYVWHACSGRRDEPAQVAHRHGLVFKAEFENLEMTLMS
jgi:hypothetical protein